MSANRTGGRPRRRSRLSVVVTTVAATLSVLVTPAVADLSTAPGGAWGTNGRVSSILAVGDRVYVGGSFTAVIDAAGVTHPAANIAVFSASTGAADLTWAGATDGAVDTIATDGSRLFVGGQFTTVDGQSRHNLAALNATDGSVVSSWKTNITGTVDALAAGGGSLFVAGGFTKVTDAAGTHLRSYIARLDPATGTLSTAWAPAPNNRVHALVLSPDATKLYIGGDFTAVGSSPATNRMAALTASSGAVLTAFKSVANNGSSFATVLDLITDGTRLYEAVGGAGGACTAVDANTGARAWSKRTNGNVQSVRILAGTAYCGGHFNAAGGFDGQTRYKLAAVDLNTGATTSFSPQINSALGVWSLGTDGTRLFAGGDFTLISKVPAQHYAVFVDAAGLGVPGPPPAPTVTADSTTIHVSWSPPASDGGTPIQTYGVYRRTAGSGPHKLATVSAPMTTYDDTSATPGTTYFYSVTATNTLGEGSPSGEVAAGLLVISAPGAPGGVSATNDAGTGVRVSWTAPVSDGGSPISHYSVYRGTASGQETLLTTTADGSVTTFDDTGVATLTTYFYFVKATNAIGDSPPSSEVSVTPGATVPTAPSLSATVGAGVVHLSWVAPASDGGSPITKYVVSRTDIGRLATVSAATAAYDDGTVVSGVTYTYQLRAVNAIGAGPYSNKVTVTIP